MRSPTVLALFSIFPQFPCPQSLLQRRELTEQLPRCHALYNPHNLPYRPLGRKRYQDVNMLLCHLHLDNFKTIFFTDLAYKLFRSFSCTSLLKYLFSIFGTPHQMVAGLVHRMTRSLYCHAVAISRPNARTYTEPPPRRDSTRVVQASRVGRQSLRSVCPRTATQQTPRGHLQCVCVGTLPAALQLEYAGRGPPRTRKPRQASEPHHRRE